MNPHSPSLPDRSSSGSDPIDLPFGPIVRMMIRDSDEGSFNARTLEFLSEIDPHDFIGTMVAEALISAVIRLRKAARLEPTDEIPGAGWCRFHSLAERNFRNACREFARHNEAIAKAKEQANPSPASPSRPRAKKAEHDVARRAEAEAALPAPPPRPESTPEEVSDAFTNWRKHIALVPAVSAEYPVILRTGREIEDINAWLDAGKSEAMLLRWFPELSLAEIAASKGCEAEGLSGPFDPILGPYPDSLPILDALPDDHPDEP